MYTHYHCLHFQVPTLLSNVPRALSPTRLGSQLQNSAQTVQLGITASRPAWPQRKGTVPRGITAPQVPLAVWLLSVLSAWCAQRAVTSPGPALQGISPTRLDNGNAIFVPMGKMKIIKYSTLILDFIMWTNIREPTRHEEAFWKWFYIVVLDSTACLRMWPLEFRPLVTLTVRLDTTVRVELEWTGSHVPRELTVSRPTCSR